MAGGAALAVWSAAFSLDGANLITAGKDGYIKLWRLTDGAGLQAGYAFDLDLQMSLSGESGESFAATSEGSRGLAAAAPSSRHESPRSN